MKKLVIAVFVALFAFALAGCGGSAQSSGSAAASGKSAGTPSATAKDFDGSGFTDTGEGTMIVSTAGGTTENGNVPEVASKPNSTMQIGIETDGMDGSVCTVYVDGMENTKINAGQRMQGTLTIKGSAVEAGTHTVELVKMDGDTPVIYKKAEYKMV